MGWKLREIVLATGGRLLRRGEKSAWGEIVTDSAKVRKGSVFVALRGERLDGHEFVNDAIKRGAECVIIHKSMKAIAGNATVVQVVDTLRALGDLAHYRREHYGPQVLAITGSNGKTTTKEMLAAILERASLDGQPLRGRVLKTEGNFNNLIGLPLTLLRLRAKDRVAVVELGTNRPGEIRRLTEIADPDMGLITSVAAAHLEGLNSLSGVAREKGALFRGVRAGGAIAVNLDDSRIRRLGDEFKGRKITYGKLGQVSAKPYVSSGPEGTRFSLRVGRRRCPVRLNFLGRHNVANAVGAAAMAHGLGIDLRAIRKGLESSVPYDMRMQVESWRGIGIINDAYNANPASMDAAVKTLAEISSSGEKTAVLGDMRELGKQSRRQHRELGKVIGRRKIDRLYLFGENAALVRKGAVQSGMAPDKIIISASHAEIARLLRGHVRKGDWLLVKGSRAMKMETVLAELKKRKGLAC